MNELVLKNWDISAPYKIIPIESSVGNLHIWMINDKYVLKQGSDLTSIKRHIEIIKALATEGVPVALPIQTICEKNYVLADGAYFCLFSKLKGKPLEDCFKGNYLKRARYLGKITAKLHLALKKCELLIPCPDNDLYQNVINYGMPTIEKYLSLDELGLTQDLADQYKNQFKCLFYQLPKQFIHRDLHGNNMIFENEELTGYIDFELSERNVRIYDLCYMSTSILCDCVYNEINREKWLGLFKNIIAGYDDICNLTKAEKQAFPYILFSIEIICIAFFSEKNYEKLVRTNVDVLKWILKNFDKLGA